MLLQVRKSFQLLKGRLPSQKGYSAGVSTCVTDSVQVSGEKRLKMAQEQARERQASLQKDLDARRLKASSTSSGSSGINTMVQVKQEHTSDTEEPMDTSSSVPNGSFNGYPSSDSPNTGLHGEHGAAQTPTRELQDFVQSTFRKHFVLCLSEVKRLFNLHLASLPTGHGRFGYVTDRMLQDTILHSHCKQILVPFPPQSSATADEQKVFVLWENGETFDKHRQVLFEVFMKNYRVRRNVIQTRLTQELGDAVTKADVDRLLKECCVSLGGMWYLKGTVQS
ncbi:DNA-directed RNA polymerase III subunit RPC5 [Tachysurus ichikawai]